jgi:signal transduction histidine kinase
MRRRIITAIMTVTTVVVLLFAVPLGFVLVRLANERAVLTLEHRADLAARTIDLTAAADAPDPNEFPRGDERFAVYTPNGTLRVGVGPSRLDPTLVRAGSNTPVTRHVGGQLVTIVPIVSGETTLGFMRASRPLDMLRTSLWRTLMLLGVGVTCVLGVGWLLAGRIAARISESTNALRDAAIAIGNGNFTTRLAPVGIAELDDVATALGHTASDLERLIANQQSFAADVSHQLRTPIAGMRTALEAETAFPRPERHTIVHETLNDLARLEQTVSDILALARNRRAAHEPIDLVSFAATTRDHWAGAFARQGRVLSVRAPAETNTAVAFGHPELLRQAIDALLDNALSHGRGTTSIEVQPDPGSEAAIVCIAVTDHGDGFPASFDPSFRGGPGHDEDDRHHGLGLALADRLVAAQSGRLILPAPGKDHPSVRILLHAPVPSG